MRKRLQYKPIHRGIFIHLMQVRSIHISIIKPLTKSVKTIKRIEWKGRVGKSSAHAQKPLVGITSDPDTKLL